MNLILSVSVLWLGISGITGLTLTKTQHNKPSDIVYKIQEDKNGASLVISNPKLEKPTLREITYYHMIERPYTKDSSDEDVPAYEEIHRFFTNGPGFQYHRVKKGKNKKTVPSRNDDNKTKNVPINDGTNQIDVRHGGQDDSSKVDQDNIAFPQENKDKAETRRRKRDIRYETSVSKKEKREANIMRVPGLPDLPSTLHMNKQPAFTNVPNSIDDMTLTPNKDENPFINGIVPRPMTPYGMLLTGNTGHLWNNFNDPYHVFHNDDNQGFYPEAYRPVEPTTTMSSLPSLSYIGTKKEMNGSPDRKVNAISSRDNGDDSQGSSYPGYGINPDSREYDSRESGNWSDESSRESGSRSDEDNRSGSGESGEDRGSSSREDNSSSERDSEKDSRESSERDSREHNGTGLRKESDNKNVKGNEEPNIKGNSDAYTDNREDTKKKFDQILTDLHNIFVKSNSTVIVPGINSNLVGAIDGVDPKKANMLSVIKGLFTNIIRNTIIVNNNVPVVQNPSVTPENDSAKPDQRLHDNVDTTTHSEGITPVVTDINSFKDTTDNPSNKTGDFKPDEIIPKLKNGTDSKNFGRPDEVTTFNATKLHNNTDKELNNNKTSVEGKNNDKLPSSTEPLNENKGKLNKKGDNKDDKKSNKTADEKANIDEGDDSKKHGNATETPVTGLKDNDYPASNKSNKDVKDTGRKNTNFDQMVDLINNDKFWKFMGDLSAKYLESVAERTTKFIKQEIEAQMDKYFKEHKTEAVNTAIQPKKKEIPSKETEKNEKDLNKPHNGVEDTTENPINNKNDAKDKKQKEDDKKDLENLEHPEAKKENAKEHRKKVLNVRSRTIYGNTIGNDKVTNVYVFYASKNLDSIMKNIKDLVNGYNTTNIFNFEPHGKKHHKIKHSHGKHEDNDPDTSNNMKNNPANTVTESTVTNSSSNSTPKIDDFTKLNNGSTDKAGNNTVNNINATTEGNNTDVTIEPSKDNENTNGTTNPSNTTDFSTKNPENITATEIPNNVTEKVETSTKNETTDVSTTKPNVTENKAENVTIPSGNLTPNVTENKAENVTIPSGNLTSADVATPNASVSTPTTDKAENSTENPRTENTNSDGKNITENGKSGNDTKITAEKDVSSNKTSDSNQTDSHNNKTTESPSTAANSTVNTAEKNNTTTDLNPGNNTGSVENPKNVTTENKNATVTSTEEKSNKSADEHKDDNSKDKPEDKKDNSDENKDKKISENQSSTVSSVDKDSSTMKSNEEATTEKNVK